MVGLVVFFQPDENKDRIDRIDRWIDSPATAHLSRPSLPMSAAYFGPGQTSPQPVPSLVSGIQLIGPGQPERGHFSIYRGSQRIRLGLYIWKCCERLWLPTASNLNFFYCTWVKKELGCYTSSTKHACVEYANFPSNQTRLPQPSFWFYRCIFSASRSTSLISSRMKQLNRFVNSQQRAECERVFGGQSSSPDTCTSLSNLCMLQKMKFSYNALFNMQAFCPPYIQHVRRATQKPIGGWAECHKKHFLYGRRRTVTRRTGSMGTNHCRTAKAKKSCTSSEHGFTLYPYGVVCSVKHFSI